MIDVSKYCDGMRGGNVKIRAKIEKDNNNRALKITEIPFGRTTSSLIDSIIKANEKGKIKIKKIDDNTARDVEILIQLAPGVSSDKTIDALYAFTDCELSISPNSCVIEEEKPRFMPISDILRQSADDTVALLKLELEIRLKELLEDLHYVSLERIFIEERIYKEKQFEESETMELVIAHVHRRLQPFLPELYREVTDDDVKKLLEIKMKRILKFSSEEADHYIRSLNEEIAVVKHNIEHIIPYSIAYYERIKAKYGKGRERKTEIRNFENIEAAKVVIANEKLYINREEGFIGTALKKDEFICECSDMDDVIVFKKDGTYYVTKVADKIFVGKDVQYVNVFKKKEKDMDIHVVCEEEHCSCEDGVLKSALKHTLKIFVYILLITFILTLVIEMIGEDHLAVVFQNIPVVGEMIAALVGLIPNCASSVVITELYLSGIIGAGAMMSGLLVNAGVGLLVLFRLNRNWKQNAGIMAALYGFGVVWGVIIELLGIVF